MALVIDQKILDGNLLRLSVTGEVLSPQDLTELFQIIDSARSSKTIINLRELTSINSSGVATWITKIRLLQEKKVDLEFEQCAILICEQMNMIPQFRGNFPITSAFAPYFCSHCDSEHEMEFQIARNDNREVVEIPDQTTCPSCGKTMEFDAIKESYLSFLKNR